MRRGLGGVVAVEFPVQAEANPRGIIQQSGGFFLAGELGELVMQRVLRRQKRFLAVENWQIGTATIVVAPDLASHQIDDYRLSALPSLDENRGEMDGNGWKWRYARGAPCYLQTFSPPTRCSV